MSKKDVSAQKKESGAKGSWLWGALLFTVLLLIDMATKFLADAYFSWDGAPTQIDIIPEWISLRITYNPGIAYGMGGDAPTWAKLLVIAGTGVLMLAFAIVYFRLDKNRTWIRIAIVFVVAGGVGNLIDRVYFRVWDATALYGVRDMVDLSRFGFAVCNFADFFITGGAVALVLALLFFDKDAMFPVGKYKKMVQAAAEAEEAKKAETFATTAETETEKDNG